LQHIVAPCKDLVKAGDKVLKGQVIADVEGGLGCPVHSSVSGTVKEIVFKRNAMGVNIEHVVIESDGLDVYAPEITYTDRVLEETSAEEITAIVRNAGISGMGGATFPTYAKISSALGKVDVMIINAAECEPFITANNRLLIEHPEAVI
jgi:electron transport complex protein RnfC